MRYLLWVHQFRRGGIGCSKCYGALFNTLFYLNKFIYLFDISSFCLVGVLTSLKQLLSGSKFGEIVHDICIQERYYQRIKTANNEKRKVIWRKFLSVFHLLKVIASRKYTKFYLFGFVRLLKINKESI